MKCWTSGLNNLKGGELSLKIFSINQVLIPFLNLYVQNIEDEDEDAKYFNNILQVCKIKICEIK